jgi:hypothetical protein
MHGFNCWARASYHAPSAALAHGRSLQFLPRDNCSRVVSSGGGRPGSWPSINAEGGGGGVGNQMSLIAPPTRVKIQMLKVASTITTAKRKKPTARRRATCSPVPAYTDQ